MQYSFIQNTCLTEAYCPAIKNVTKVKLPYYNQPCILVFIINNKLFPTKKSKSLNNKTKICLIP